jgi:hypothetical protein
MKNVQASVEGKTLVLRIDMTQDFGKSKTGKTTIVATTGGNVSIPGTVEGLKVGVNCYLDK